MIYLALTALIFGLASIGVDTEEAPLATSEDIILSFLAMAGFALLAYLLTREKK
jgi:hypothetical protein